MRNAPKTVANVMLAEENSEIRRIIAEFLENQGYSVSGFSSPEDLESALTGANPDFILMNVGEKDMSGIRVLRSIRSMSRFDDIPVVMLSGEKDPAVISRCVHDGADGVLNWPYSAELLSQNMKALLSGRTIPLNMEAEAVLRGMDGPPGPVPDGPSRI